MATVGVVGVAGGVAADWVVFYFDEPLLWVPDLVVGVALISAGGVAVGRAAGTGFLFVATGIAWFAGTVAPGAIYWHRGLLVHLLVSYPRDRPVARAGWLVVFGGYAAALVSPLWRGELTSLVLAAVAFLVSVGGLRVASVRRRRISCGVGAGLAVVLMAGAVARLAVSGGCGGCAVVVGL